MNIYEIIKRVCGTQAVMSGRVDFVAVTEILNIISHRERERERLTESFTDGDDFNDTDQRNHYDTETKVLTSKQHTSFDRTVSQRNSATTVNEYSLL